MVYEKEGEGIGYRRTEGRRSSARLLRHGPADAASFPQTLEAQAYARGLGIMLSLRETNTKVSLVIFLRHHFPG